MKREVLEETLHNEQWLRGRCEHYKQMGVKSVPRAIREEIKSLGVKVSLTNVYHWLYRFEIPFQTRKQNQESTETREEILAPEEPELVEEWGLEPEHARKLKELIKKEESRALEKLAREKAEVEKLVTVTEAETDSKIERIVKAKLEVSLNSMKEELKEELCQFIKTQLPQSHRLNSVEDLIEGFLKLLEDLESEMKKLSQLFEILYSLATPAQKERLDQFAQFFIKPH